MPFERGQPPELDGLAAALEGVAPRFDVPPGLGDRVLAAVRAEAASANGGAVAAMDDSRSVARSVPPEIADPLDREPVRRRARSSVRRRFAIALAGLAVIGAAVLAGTRLDPGAKEPSGPVEIAGTMTAVGGDGRGDVVVTLLGTGREIGFVSSSLPVLPTGDYYELWFVGPGDSAAEPNRVSGGTFHPDEDGDTDVQLHAAVDPRKYPLVEITAEPGDGDPAPGGEIVLELDATDLIRPD